MPTISVIVPVYKVEAYLDRCVQSILSQTYKDFELILVDDGSPDCCPQMCDEWAKKDNRIRVIHKENGGLSSARNAGLDVALGEYISFIDGDDYILSEFLETVVTPMSSGCDSVTIAYSCIWANGKSRHIHVTEDVFVIENQEQRYDFLLFEFMKCNISYQVTNRIYSRAKIERLGLRFVDNSRIFAEDLYFNLCYFGDVQKVISIDNPLYIYAIREDSITGGAKQQNRLRRVHELGKEVVKFWERKKYSFLVKRFAIFYYIVIAEEMDRLEREISSEPRQQIRKMTLQELGDRSVYSYYLKNLCRYRKEMIAFYGRTAAMERLSYVQYLVDGNSMTYMLRNYINYRLSAFYR